jgi:hypothetical protein
MTSETTLKPAKPVNVNVLEIVAATLSAVSTAIAASFLGVTGTIAGAAVGSVLGTIATAFYTHSLTRGHERLRAWTPWAGRATRDPAPPRTVAGTLYGRRRRRRWPIAVATTAAAFALGIGAITMGELAFGHPLANLFGGHNAGTTSIGNLPGETATTPAGTDQTPTGPTSSTDTSTAPEPTATTSEEPTGPTRSGEPNEAPTAPEPTVAPTPTQP